MISGEARRSLMAALAMLALLVLAAGAYWPGLNGPLLFDDAPVLSGFFQPDGSSARPLGQVIFSNTGPLQRPVAMLSFYLNGQFSGADLWSWKLTNLLLHLLTGLVIFGLTAHVVSVGEKRVPPGALMVGLIVGGIWVLHPLHVSTVLYTVQRMTILGALFVFAGLLLYVIGRKRQLNGQPGHVHIGISLLVFLPAAAFSKESGLLLPLFVFLAEIFLFRFSGNRRQRRGLVVLFVALIALPLIIGVAVLVVRFDAMYGSHYLARSFSLTERLLTEMRVVGLLYPGLLLLPMQSRMGFYYDDYVISQGLFDPLSTVLALVVLVVALAVIWFSRRRIPLLSFGLIFYLAGHLLESSIFPLELVFEHRNYLPSWGLFLAVAGIVTQLSAHRRVVGVFVAGVLLALAALTSVRAELWSTHNGLYAWLYSISPGSYRVISTLAHDMTERGQYAEAIALLSSIESPATRLHRLYIQCRRDGELPAGDLRQITEQLGVRHSTYSLTVIIRLSNLGLDGACQMDDTVYLELLKVASQGIFRVPSDWQKLMMYVAHYERRLGQLDHAVQTLYRIWEALPDNPVPLFLATEMRLDAGQVDAAREIFAKARSVAHDSSRDYARFIDLIAERFAGEPR